MCCSFVDFFVGIGEELCGVVPLFEKVWKRWYVANSGNGLFAGYS